ncbi:MAG: cell wall-binding repeat-containing protein [Actinomycetota bacterium]|nr:cell wall-binding repeat-containing protein [Actinomycetota bacterium]
MTSMKSATMPFAVLALAIGLLGTVPAASDAATDPSGAWSEPLGGPSIIDGTGEQAEQRLLDQVTLPAATFDSQAVGDVVTITGAGNGHGVGMSQWGSQGRALDGQSYTQILASYYQGTALAQDNLNEPLWVNLESELVKVQLKVEQNMSGGAPVTVTRDDTAIPASTVAPAGILEEIVLNPGDTLVVEYLDRDGVKVAPINNPRRCSFSSFAAGTDPATAEPVFSSVEGSCVIDLEWDGWNGDPTTRIVIDKQWAYGTSAAGDDCVHKVGVTLDCAYARGTMHIRPDDFDESEPYDTGFHVVQELSLDDYARGIGEMPYSWDRDALKVQAVAARSFARYLQQTVRADPIYRQWSWSSLYDRGPDQMYLGWGFDEVAVFGSYAANWVAAVNETVGQLLLTNGRYISANYSASNGGASENNEDIWGGSALSYLRSTSDPLDLISANPLRSWTRSVPTDYFAAKVGLDVVTSADIVSTYVSGSPRDIAVSGIRSGVETTKHYTATQFMALFSDTAYRLFAPRITSVDVPEVTTPPPSVPVEFQIERWWGRDRYVTAVEISKANFPSGANSVFIATGEKFPDAVAAAPLAYVRNAPVLLSKTSSIPQETIDEIRRLKPDRIYILGGTAAVSAEVATRLESFAPVTRVWGHDRYATAAEISKATYPAGAGVVYVATGRNFPDPLVGAPLAGYNGGPILLTDGAALTGATLGELARLAPKSIVVVGAGTSVSQTIVDQLKAYAPVTGISGSDRYETSVKMSQQTFGQARVVFVATGAKFPDALAVGPVAISDGGPLLFVSTTSLPSTVAAELVRLDPDRVVILGGTAAVSTAVEEAIDALFD